MVDLFIYLKLILSISVHGKLFKNILIYTQSKYGDDTLHFKSVSVRQKNGCIFMFTVIYCKTNFWSYCQIYGLSCIMGDGTNFKDMPDVTWEALGK